MTQKKGESSLRENLIFINGYIRVFLRNRVSAARKYSSIKILCHLVVQMLARIISPVTLYRATGIWPFSPVPYSQFKVWGRLDPPVSVYLKGQPRSNHPGNTLWQPCGRMLPEERMGYVIEVEKGFALRNGITLDQKGHTIMGASPNFRATSRSGFRKKLEDWGPLTRRSWNTKLVLKHYPGTVLVLSNSFGNRFYGHYLYEVLGRLALVEDQMDAYQTIYIPNEMPYQKRYLTMLGLTDKQIIAADQAMPSGITADRLVIPCLRRIEDYLIDPQITGYLRRKLLPYADSTLSRGERIYVSRRKARRRHILNEQELLPIFLKYGFSVVCLEDYSVDEQISILRFAKIVVSPQGTGLVNLLYCDPGTKVLEIFPGTNAGIEITFVIATSLNLDYFYLMGTGVGARTPALNDDMIVDLDVFEREIELLCR